MIRQRRILGHLSAFWQDPTATLTRLALNNERVPVLRLVSRRLYLVTSPADVHHVLKFRSPNYIKGRTMDVIRPLMGDNVATADGDAWRRWRRLLHPAFEREHLYRSLPEIEETVRGFLPTWDALAVQGKPVDVVPLFLDMTFAVIVRLLTGLQVGDSLHAFTRAFSRVMKVLNTIAWSPSPRLSRWAVVTWPPFRQARRWLDQQVAEIVAWRRQQPLGPDLLYRLLHEPDPSTQRPLTFREVRDQLLVLLLAGHETTAYTLAWLWALFTRHPQVARRVQEEVRRVLGDGPLTPDAIPALAYTRAVIDEAMRLYPAVWVIARDAAAADEIAGHPIPAGARVLVSPFVTHRRPDVWEHPEAFIPERFLDATPRAPFAYYPFGGGPRKCLGHVLAPLEMLVVVVTLMRRYAFVAVPGHAPVPKPVLTLRPHPGVWVYVHTLAR